MKVAHTRDDATFDQAFAAARDAGCEEFIWRNARYHTRRADDRRSPAQPVIQNIEEDQ